MIKRVAMLAKMEEKPVTSGNPEGESNNSGLKKGSPNGSPAHPLSTTVCNTGLARKSSIKLSEAQKQRGERRESMLFFEY